MDCRVKEYAFYDLNGSVRYLIGPDVPQAYCTRNPGDSERFYIGEVLTRGEYSWVVYREECPIS